MVVRPGGRARLSSWTISTGWSSRRPSRARSPARFVRRTLGDGEDERGRAQPAFVRAIETRGIDFVGQETVTLSTTPVWADGRLEPHPFIFRVFVAATEDGYTVMPGGFALIGDKNDVRAVSMQQGARSADVWVLSDGPVAQTTAPSAPRQVRDPQGHLGAAEPRRRQSLLARPLHRARRGYAAARQGAWPCGSRSAREARSRGHDRACAICFSDGVLRRALRCRASLGQSAAAAMFDTELDGAVPALVARGAPRRVRDPRPLSDRRLARARGSQRLRACSRSEPRGIASRCLRRGEHGAAHHRGRQRLPAREHEPARGLELPEARPQHRARARDVPLCAPVRRGGERIARKSSTSFSSSATRRSPTACAIRSARRLAPVLDLVLLDRQQPARARVPAVAHQRAPRTPCRCCPQTTGRRRLSPRPSACSRPSSALDPAKVRADDAARHRERADALLGRDLGELLPRPAAGRAEERGAVIYEIRQLMRYSYGSYVPVARHLMRLQPLSGPALDVLESEIRIDPAPAERADAIDFFGNGDHAFQHQGAAQCARDREPCGRRSQAAFRNRGRRYAVLGGDPARSASPRRASNRARRCIFSFPRRARADR